MQQKYKIKLNNGRILGPLTLQQVVPFIEKKIILGIESARTHPEGEWKTFVSIPELALLLTKVTLDQGGKSNSIEISKLNVVENGNKTQETFVLPQEHQSDKSLAQSPPPEPPVPPIRNQESEPTRTELNDLEPTLVSELIDPTNVENISKVADSRNLSKRIQSEPTVVLQRNSSLYQASKKKNKNKRYELIRSIVMIGAVWFVGAQLLEGSNQKVVPIKWEPIRAKFPSYRTDGKNDPKASETVYQEAMKSYVEDTFLGYKKALEKLRVSAALDLNNIKAKAMLASCYLNLIDFSNKDENYFMVVSKLIDQTRSSTIELPETVIADTEFFVTVDKPEVAQNRIVGYTKEKQKFGLELFYYLAYSFYHRGDLQSALTYLANIPDTQVFSPKVFYLRGSIYEKNNQFKEALIEYQKAVHMVPDHAKSRLRISEILASQGALGAAKEHIEYLVGHARLLPPKETAQAYYLNGRLFQLNQKWNEALGAFEKSVKLDKENHDYLLELYTTRHQLGVSDSKIKQEAQMYFFLSEGEKYLKAGKRDEALVQFLKAREINDASPLPPLKIGDMFLRDKNMVHARENYKLAADRALNDIQVWSKYIDVLILSFDWEEAQKAMDRFRKLPVSQSALDKAAGDLYAKQQRWSDAVVFYKKAMARDTIDPDVYISYAQALLAVKNYKDAPFFFSLAKRFDPLNPETTIGTAKAVAGAEGLQQGVRLLEDEIQKKPYHQVQFLAAAAEMYLQQGDWTNADLYIDRAIQSDSSFGEPYRLRALVYLGRDPNDKATLDKAAAAYKSFSERSKSDVSGYIERYKIFIKKADFEAAKAELIEITTVYPKYPNLHYYLGAMYSFMGNHKVAAAEFETELKNNPDGVNTLLALGKEYVELADIPAAHKLFQKTMQLATKASEPKHWTGYTTYLMKNYSGAIALLNSASQIDPGNALIYKRLGMAYRDMGEAYAAQNAFKKYLELEPDAPDKAEIQAYIQ